MAKLNFQQLILQSSVSHDSLEIDLLLEKHFLLLSKLKKVVLINILVENRTFFSNVKVFTVTFDLFHASLLWILCLNILLTLWTALIFTWHWNNLRLYQKKPALNTNSKKPLCLLTRASCIPNATWIWCDTDVMLPSPPKHKQHKTRRLLHNSHQYEMSRPQRQLPHPLPQNPTPLLHPRLTKPPKKELTMLKAS